MPKSQLVELFAHGIGVIDDARVEFGVGFNVITGETGAGKTLLLDALDLCLGGDAATSRQAVQGDMRAAAVFLQRDGREVVFTREASSTGRLRSSLDAVSSSAEALRALAG
jgi:DNA repair protein RecN (Recombination protein N)